MLSKGLIFLIYLRKWWRLKGNTVLLVERNIWDGSRRQNSNLRILALPNLLQNFSIDCLGNLICHEALPFEKPIRRNHVPFLPLRLLELLLAHQIIFVKSPPTSQAIIGTFFPRQFQIQNHFALDFAPQFQSVNLFWSDSIGFVQQIFVRFQRSKLFAKRTLDLLMRKLPATRDTEPHISHQILVLNNLSRFVVRSDTFKIFGDQFWRSFQQRVHSVNQILINFKFDS